MMHYPFDYLGGEWVTGLPVWAPVFFIPIVLWVLFWKGLALWHSGRRGDSWWFVILLVVNTVGILEMVYLFVVIKLKFSQLFEKTPYAFSVEKGERN
jgi:hypothetical protein